MTTTGQSSTLQWYRRTHTTWDAVEFPILPGFHSILEDLAKLPFVKRIEPAWSE